MQKTAIFLVLRLSIAFYRPKVVNKPIYSPLEANASEKAAYDKGEKLSKARAKKEEKAREKEWSAERKIEKTQGNQPLPPP